MHEILIHSDSYQRAVKLLHQDWEVDGLSLFHNRLQGADVRFARLLQAHGLVPGEIDLENYRAVSELTNQHPQWFSTSARHELLRPFEGWNSIIVDSEPKDAVRRKQAWQWITN